ncbi:biotin/lipoyl-containing protein [Pseudacidobacterium ailaaui]|uniref:biotin/lipoyl-containing protein n=1 Tax=Pseudacidobacterium ailaaui TaxID=1382359 RepID=UPI000678845F|nr:biotin/lipoyl-containing protein [Pseudacidobacterium ailaaui]MBX6359525.1 acetyl-CoA carboxylase biotin carboxyl carrier protein subunit [Pseudacidobacterium ailaaui]
MILQLEMDGQLRRVELSAGEAPGSFRAVLDGSIERQVEAHWIRPGVLALQVACRSYRCVLEESIEGPVLHVAGARVPYHVEDPRSLKSRRSRTGGHEGPKAVTAPMPGRVVRVLVNEGEEVQSQQGTVVIEAMKMQNELKSPKAGKVIEVRVQPGGTVAAGEVLVVVE